MNGHTPGPWVIDEFYESGGFYKIRSAAEMICHTHVFAPHGREGGDDAAGICGEAD